MDKGVREAKDLGDVGGIQGLVAGGSLGCLKLGTRSAVGKGMEVREDREHKSPRKWQALHPAAPGNMRL